MTSASGKRIPRLALVVRVGRLFWIFVVVLAVGVDAASPPVDQAPPSVRNTATEILWDTWGVPHIFGKDATGLFRAFGWAQMQSHGNLVLRLYGQARGRAAEYWGKDYLDSDRWVHTMGVPRRAAEWARAQSPAMRNNLEAFVTGMNSYAGEHPDQIANEVKVVLPISASDVIAHGQRVILFHFVTNPESVKNSSERWREAGSNAWAIAPKHSANGHALLLANPHLPWRDFFLWYEAQLTAPGINAYGATLVGSPILGIAFNDYLGWTHTVNTHDGEDLYELTLTEGGYRWGGGVRAFEEEKQILKIKQGDGTFHEEELLVRRSIHGPVLAEKNGRALALRVVGLDQSRNLEQYWDMARAKNLAGFQRALQEMQMPMFTVMYADREGHIMHLFGGETPVRPKGNYDWAGIVPGDTATTLWTKMHPYKDLPRVIDPPSGWLQNANDPPWTTTFPPELDPDKFPSYMAPRFMSFRAQRSARMLSEHDRVSFDEMVRDKFSTRMELADRILDDLAMAVKKHGGEKARHAMMVLEGWDRCADAESRGAVLFEAFFEELRQHSKRRFAVEWNGTSPRTTPDGLADPAAAVAALETAATKVEADYGKLDVPWGEVHRFRRGKIDLPGNGGPGDLFGIFRAIYYHKAADGRFEAVGGDSYVAAIEFSNPVRAQAVLAPGNASQPGSPHLNDQLLLVARKELRPVWRTRAEIETHLESRKVF